MGTAPSNAKSKQDTRDLAALKAENRRLRRQLAQMAAENLSQANTMRALNARTDGCPVCERLRQAEARAQSAPLRPYLYANE